MNLEELQDPARIASLTPQQMVLEFHKVYNCAIRTEPTADIPETQLRLDLIEEEFNELKEAAAQKDIVAIADALADLLYVTYGYGIVAGIDLDMVLREVQKSNLSKLTAEGEVIRRADGKILKSNLFSPPDIKSILFP